MLFSTAPYDCKSVEYGQYNFFFLHFNYKLIDL
jgi:hypothetical protein